MPRTTIDIDARVLRELRELQREKKGSLGRLVSDILLEAIPRIRRAKQRPDFNWQSSEGSLQVDLLDKDAVYGALDRQDDLTK